MNSYNLSRIGIAFIWLYHGLVPKLIFRHVTELKLIESGPVIGSPVTTLVIAGIGEVVLGLLVVFFWKRRWPILLSLVGFAFLLLASLMIAPEQATHAFNPVTLTVSAILFCLIQLSAKQSLDSSPE